MSDVDLSPCLDCGSHNLSHRPSRKDAGDVGFVKCNECFAITNFEEWNTRGPNKRQSRRLSAIESAANIIVGMAIALIGQMIIFPLLGIAVTLEQNVMIMWFFTILSFVRSYTLRRVFSGLSLK